MNSRMFLQCILRRMHFKLLLYTSISFLIQFMKIQIFSFVGELQPKCPLYQEYKQREVHHKLQPKKFLIKECVLSTILPHCFGNGSSSSYKRNQQFLPSFSLKHSFSDGLPFPCRSKPQSFLWRQLAWSSWKSLLFLQ